MHTLELVKIKWDEVHIRVPNIEWAQILSNMPSKLKHTLIILVPSSANYVSYSRSYRKNINLNYVSLPSNLCENNHAQLSDA